MDSFIDRFETLRLKANIDGAVAAIKFRTGLLPSFSNSLAESSDPPAIDQLADWYSQSRSLESNRAMQRNLARNVAPAPDVPEPTLPSPPPSPELPLTVTPPPAPDITPLLQDIRSLLREKKKEVRFESVEPAAPRVILQRPAAKQEDFLRRPE